MEKKPEIPAGAAIILIDEEFLRAILNLPDDIHVHHTFVPGAHWGQSFGIMLTTDTPGRLPPVKLGEAAPYLQVRGTTHVLEGKSYHQVEVILPEGKADG